MITCPECGSNDRRVIASRRPKKEGAMRRRCVCSACGFRFTTFERIETGEPKPVAVDPVWLKRLKRIEDWIAELREMLPKDTAATLRDSPCTVPAGQVPIEQLSLRKGRSGELARDLARVVDDRLIYQKRPGGLLSS
jgi:hypothetical protein